MGGPASITVNPGHHTSDHNNGTIAEAAISTAAARLAELERKYSRFDPYSLISQINARAGSEIFTPIDVEMRSLISLADQLWRETEGLFDPTVGVLNQVWDFNAGKSENPDRLRDLLDKVGWDRVECDERGIRLPLQGMELDLGGLVKEFAADCAAAILRDAGIRSALVELAGDIVALGGQTSDAAWQIGIRDPQAPADSIVSVQLTNAAICSSGNYARRFHHNGKFVSHLLHPQTGQPIDGPCSVSVIGESALVAGTIATAACLQDEAGAQTWLDQSALPWLMINKENYCLGTIQ
jgi:FAD:protein FMN transferase